MSHVTQGVIDTQSSPYFTMRSVPVPAVALGDGFWQPRRCKNVEASIPSVLQTLEEHGVVDNFRRLSGRVDAPRRDRHYTDSDLYKWLEAVGFALQSEDNPTLRATADEIIRIIANAQEDDGYIHTFWSDQRWQHLHSSHEMYCGGHLIQAGIAYYRATGDDTLLTVGRRFADVLCREFGPGKREITDGHPEIELALVELYRETGEQHYLDLAVFFTGLPQSQYSLPPIAKRPYLVSHCVRSGYICSGGADIYAETGDESLLANLKRLWADLVGGKMYITGGVGARYQGEAFGEPYELPNLRAYAETCSQISHFMWAWRMLLITREATYADAMERIIYNGFLSGVSLSGIEYFYRNPQASNGFSPNAENARGHDAREGYQRNSWWETMCCPPNIERTLASLPGYFFSTADEGIWVHLYDRCEATLQCADTAVALAINTDYPWDGEIAITVTPEAAAEFSLFSRIPEWATNATISVNDATAEAIAPGYAEIKRTWQPGDVVRISLPMPARFTRAHPYVAENRGCIAIERGPIVYCFEGIDNPDSDVRDLYIPADSLYPASWTATFEADMLCGLTVLRGEGAVPDRNVADGPLYGPTTVGDAKFCRIPVTAIPYYAWANRGVHAMRIWVPILNCGK